MKVYLLEITGFHFANCQDSNFMRDNTNFVCCLSVF